jgi:hypothetical protein
MIDIREGAERLAQELGHFPLALDQAASFINAQQITFDDYLNKLSANFKKMSSRKPKLNWPYNMTLFSTWELSFEAIERKNPAACRILRIYALFGSQDFDVNIFEPLVDFEPSFQSSNTGT